jgi:HPt (histidine-containing phosphotransfer) domain-containing protein
MTSDASTIVNWSDLAQARAQLGGEFVRILGYFREDGIKSVAEIEDAMRRRDATALVRPAHTLKGESLQFGGEQLGLLSEHIEHTARRCVETRESPDELLESVVRLRPLFNETIALFDREIAASAGGAVRRPVVFGRKAG